MSDESCQEVPDAVMCCDMRGMLSFMILWLLTKEPMHGQQIAEEIAKRRGTKPSPGTIYPALKDLTQRGLVQGEKKGRRVTYTLTPRGSQGIDRACHYFCQAFQEIFEEYR